MARRRLRPKKVATVGHLVDTMLLSGIDDKARRKAQKILRHLTIAEKVGMVDADLQTEALGFSLEAAREIYTDWLDGHPRFCGIGDELDTIYEAEWAAREQARQWSPAQHAAREQGDWPMPEEASFVAEHAQALRRDHPALSGEAARQRPADHYQMALTWWRHVGQPENEQRR
jgi:hypothetical protein